MPKQKKSKYTLRKDGRIQKKIPVIKDGNTTYKVVYANSEGEMDRILDEIGYQQRKGMDVSARNDTFEQWLLRLLRVKEKTISHKKYKSYKSRAKHLAPIYHYKVTEIRSAHVQEVIFDMSEKTNHRTGKPYSTDTIKTALSLISMTMDLAIQNRLIDFNPTKGIVLPKGADPKKRRALTYEEREWINNTEHRGKTAAMILMYAGLRRGGVDSA